MTPAQLSMLIDADNRFNDPERQKQQPSSSSRRIEDVLRERGFKPDE